MQDAYRREIIISLIKIFPLSFLFSFFVMMFGIFDWLKIIIYSLVISGLIVHGKQYRERLR